MAESLCDRIGGADTVSAAVDGHYVKMLADDRVKEFFNGVDMAQLGIKQKAFLVKEFGGPDNYSGRDMRSSHVNLPPGGLNGSHVDAFVENLIGSFKDQGVADSLLAEIKGVLEGHRKDVLNG